MRLAVREHQQRAALGVDLVEHGGPGADVREHRRRAAIGAGPQVEDPRVRRRGGGPVEALRRRLREVDMGRHLAVGADVLDEFPAWRDTRSR